MSKRLDWIIGCEDKASLWDSIAFPDGSNIGSTIACRGETHRYSVHLINRHAGTPNKTKTKDMMSLDYSSICNIASRIGWVSMEDIYTSWV